MAARFESGSLESYGAAEANGTNITVPDAALLFMGDYSRAGTDLTISGSDGAKFVVAGYFNTDTPPSLLSPQGAMLTGDVVTALAGPQFPGQYAQAGDPQGAEAIGKVQTLDGSATVVRANGVTETLEVGEAVFQGDVVMTGPASKLGIGFVDGTVFSMSANARMVLNSLVYDPDGSNNSMLFSLVEGSFVFAAGKIAPTGDMKIQTPVATMGIRGTTPTVEIVSGATTGGVNFSILPDPVTGHVGAYTLFNLESGEPMGSISSVGSYWVLTSADGSITQYEKSDDDLLRDAEAISQINSVYNTYQNNTQNPQAGPENNPPNSSGLNTNPQNDGGIEGNNNTGGGGGENNQNNNNQNNNQQGNPPPGGQTNNDPPPIEDPTGGAGVNVINGTPFDDNGEIVDEVQNPPKLFGTDGNDFIFGFAGDDYIDAGAGDDFVFAGDDDDTIIGGSGEGDDQYDGGEGCDTLVYTSTGPGEGVVINLVTGIVTGTVTGTDTFISIEKFIGGSGDDTLIIGADGMVYFNGNEGTDTILFAGDLDIDTGSTMIEAENIEIVDLNDDGTNTLTISVDDFLGDDWEEEEPNNTLQIRGGTTDTVNLTNLMHLDDPPEFEGINSLAVSDGLPGYGIYEGSGGFFEGVWQQTGEIFTAEDGTVFDIYHFISPEDDEPLAVAQIEQGVEVNFLVESFENGFEARDWEFVGPASITTDMSTEGMYSALLTTTTGNENDQPDGTGGSEDEEPDERGNAEDIADLIGVDVEELDELAETENSDGFVIEGAAILTSFYAMAGQTISFDWFFSTFEFDEGDGEGGSEFVNDIAFVVIDGEIYKLFDAESTGNPTEGNLATEGWNGFTTVLTEDGEHEIAFGVLDNEDDEVETNLKIDNIRLGPIGLQSAAFGAAVMTFDEGFGSPPSFTEAGVTVESHYGGEDGGGHLHLGGEAIFNHSACCSEPYHFEATEGGTFSFLGFNLTQISTTGGIWTSSNGGHVDLSGASLGYVDFSSNPDFQNIEWVKWFQPQGSSTIDDVAFSGGGQIVITGTEQKDILIGQDFSEALLGLGGDDMLDGQDGDDVLDGGSGNNTLTGGEGADKFVITGLGDGIDTITDYEGIDALDLSAYLTDPLNSSGNLGDVIDEYISTITDEDGNTTVLVDPDGDAGPGTPTAVAVLQDYDISLGISIMVGNQEADHPPPEIG